MSVRLADQINVKTPGEVRVIDMDFARDLATAETISAVSGVVFAPTTGTIADDSSGVSGSIAQITISGGLTEVNAAVTATDDTFTKSSHGLANGDRVKAVKRAGCTFPGGLTAATETDESLYYVVASTTNTFQLSCHSGGTAETITSDGACTVFIEYLVTVTVTTSASQTLVGAGRLQVRT